MIYCFYWWGDNKQDLGKIAFQVQSYMERFRELQSMKYKSSHNTSKMEHFTVLGLDDVIRVFIHQMKDKRPITQHCLVFIYSLKLHENLNLIKVTQAFTERP